MLGITAGGTVDRQVLDQAQQRLYETGIFRTVDIDLTPSAGATATPLAVDALVALEERPKYRLRYGVQFGPTTLDNVTTENNSAEPGATIDLQRRNLFGLGITAGGGGVWSASQHRIRATASAATLAGRFVSTPFTIEHANEDRQSDNYGIDIVDRSLRAVLEQRWRRRATPRMEFAYGFDVDHRRLELLATAAEPLPLRARVADLNATFVYDTRDSFFSPKRGLFHTSRIEAGAGAWLSDIPFVRYQLQQFFYFPAGRTTLASGVRFGSLHADTVAQPSSLLLFFHTGGSNSVRGYEDDSLTPGYVIGVPAGGKALLVLNQEVRVPIWRRLGAVGFADLGNTFEELTALRLRSLKVAAGAGVRFETAVAVLRLDVGLPLPPLPGQPRARWYLSIGHAF
jgi:outer membrane translocation and assembly module TamA